MRNPPPLRGIPTVPLAPGPQGDLTTQGMVSPIDAFVDSNGALSGISFRFLYGLYKSVQQLLDAGAPLIEGVFSASAALATPPFQPGNGLSVMGLGLSFTPQFTTRAFVTIDGTISNQLANGLTLAIMAWGTGPPPPAGSPNTYPFLGGVIRFTAGVAFANASFSRSAIMTNLTKGTQYWVDLAAATQTGAGGLSDLYGNAFGLLDPS